MASLILALLRNEDHRLTDTQTLDVRVVALVVVGWLVHRRCETLTLEGLAADRTLQDPDHPRQASPGTSLRRRAGRVSAH